jgi:hypothetical protein
MSAGAAKFVCAFIVASIAGAAPALAGAAPSCAPGTLKEITIKGTIRFVRSTVRPFIGPDGKADYSIFDTIDEYEVSAPDMACGPRLRVRFEYGDVQYVACADHVPATVSGFLQRDASDGSVFLSVVSPSDLVCKAPE